MAWKQTLIIYRAVNLINDKSYIGQTTHRLSDRIRSHTNPKNNTVFGNAIKK